MADGERSPAEQQLLRLLSHAADLVLIVDEELRIRWSSLPGSRLLGERVPASLSELVSSDDLHEFSAAFRRALEHPGAVEVFTHRLRGPEAEPAFVQTSFQDCRDDAAIGGVLVMLREATDKTGTEQDLRRRTRSLEAIIEELPVGVVVVRRALIGLVNRSLEVMTARPRSELIGLAPDRLIVNDDQHRWQALLAGVGRGGRSSTQELNVVRSDGSHALAEISALSIGFEGEPAILLFFSDLTERRALRARLAFSDRMVAIGTLAAGVAHEVNNPLAFMTMNLAFIDEELERLAKEHALGGAFTDVLSALRDARAGCSRVRQVVHDLRTFSRADEHARTRIDVVQVLETCLSMTRNEIRHRAQLVKAIEPVPLIHANHAQLAQVFLNLLLNAVQAIDEGDAAHNEIAVSLRHEMGKIILVIRDTGTGISLEHFPRIFDPFFTTKPVGTGTGLGLSICHNIVAGLGGHISVESREGHGSTFTVELPVLTPVPVAEQPRRSGQRRRLRLLIVDDDESVGLSLMRALRDVHDISYAEDARRALTMLREGQRFDAVLCDVLMPDMSGNELFEQLLAELPEQAERVIFMTAGAFTSNADNFFHRRARWRLEKPFSVEQVESLIAEVIGAQDGRSS